MVKMSGKKNLNQSSATLRRDSAEDRMTGTAGMKVIRHRTDSVVGAVLGVVLLVSLTALTCWLSVERSWTFPFTLLLIAFWLFGVYGLVERIKRRESCILGIEDGSVVWVVTTKDSPAPNRHAVPLRSLRSLEIVFPRVRWEPDTKDYAVADAFLVDVHRNRHKLPCVLCPAFYHKEIFEGLQKEAPNLAFVERTQTKEEVESGAPSNEP